MTQPKHCAETRLAEMQKREQRMMAGWNEVFDKIEGKRKPA